MLMFCQSTPRNWISTASILSGDFCKVLGYSRKELIGKRFDAITAPNTNNTSVVFELFLRNRYMHGIWIFLDRSRSTKILVRYEAWCAQTPESTARWNCLAQERSFYEGSCLILLLNNVGAITTQFAFTIDIPLAVRNFLTTRFAFVIVHARQRVPALFFFG
jgi:hypothetical protein